MQIDLFNTDKKNTPPNIPGLSYIPDFITEHEQKLLLEMIDSAPWLLDLKRRVQHYGYKYDYKKRTVDPSMKVGDLPDWIMQVGTRIKEMNFMEYVPDQVIVNEYEPGQGIAPHIDCEPCFENVIASLSLGSFCLMDFYKKEDLKIKKSFTLKPGSLLVLNDESRYKWLHGIAARKSDMLNNEKHLRERRISLTFRKVILR